MNQYYKKDKRKNTTLTILICILMIIGIAMTAGAVVNIANPDKPIDMTDTVFDEVKELETYYIEELVVIDGYYGYEETDTPTDYIVMFEDSDGTRCYASLNTSEYSEINDDCKQYRQDLKNEEALPGDLVIEGYFSTTQLSKSSLEGAALYQRYNELRFDVPGELISMTLRYKGEDYDAFAADSSSGFLVMLSIGFVTFILGIWGFVSLIKARKNLKIYENPTNPEYQKYANANVFVNQRLKREKTLLLLTIASFLLMIAVFVVASMINSEYALAGIGFIYLFIAVLIAYLVARPFGVMVRWLNKNGYENVTNDINAIAPTLPKSKIFCGSRAMLCKKPCIIVPYSEIMWTYKHVTKSYGVTVATTYYVCLKNGKKYTINADETEFIWLLDNVVSKANPQLIVGFGPQQSKAYREFVKQYKSMNK